MIPLKKLKLLEAAAPFGRLLSTHITQMGYEHLANLTEGAPSYRCLAMLPLHWSDYIASMRNELPRMIKEIERLRKCKSKLKRKLGK